jgi:2-isopropylmalate synthase
MAYVGLTYQNKMYWGVGMDEDIIRASISALVVAVNKLLEVKKVESVQDERFLAMQNYIQVNYQTVTLSELAEEFHLSEPYVSKYIKEKSGKTFGDLVQNARMKKARTLLRNSSMTVENIAYAAGYQNVEHFNRQFKKKFGITPVEYRNQK